jgi:hypothetical protein
MTMRPWSSSDPVPVLGLCRRLERGQGSRCRGEVRRTESLIDEIRHASRRSTEQEAAGSGDAEEAAVYRIRFIEPISADFAVLVGDAIRNLRSSLNQVADQLAVQHSGPLTEDQSELPIRISGAQFDDWATSKNKQAKLRRSEIFGKRGRDDSLGTSVRRAAEAISKRSREDAVGRSQEAERDNDVGFVLNRLRNVYKHRRLPLLAATLAP